MRRVFAFLGVSPDEGAAILAPLHGGEEIFGALRGPGGWLHLPVAGDEMLSMMRSVFERFTRTVSPEAIDKLGEFIDRSPLPPSVLETLVMGLFCRMTRPEGDPGKESRVFAAGLMTRYPRQFRRATNLCWPYLNELAVATEKAAASSEAEIGPALQAPARTMYFAETARKQWKKGRALEAIEAALQAWSHAFEGPIMQVCIFLWYMSKPLSEPDDAIAPPRSKGSHRGDLRKSHIFKTARDWCEKEHIAFPFYDKLDKLRSSHAHGDYENLGKSVRLIGQDGAHVDTMAVRDLVARLQQDVQFAMRFADELQWAHVEQLDRSGAFDQAWATARQYIPALDRAVRPGLPRRRRAHPSRR